MKLVGYQLYRFFSDSRRTLFVVVLLALNLVLFRSYNAAAPTYDGGEILGEGREQVQSTAVTDTVSSAEEYRDNISRVLSLAREGMGEDTLVGRYQREVNSVYSDLLEENAARLENASFSASRIFTYRSDMLVLAVILFLLVKTLSADDIALGLLPVLAVAKKGRGPLALSKIAAVFLVSLGGVLFTTGAEALLSLGTSDWFAPVQATAGMALCPFVLTTAGALILVMAARVLALTVFALLLMIGANALRNIWGLILFTAAVVSADTALSATGVSGFSPMGAFGLWRMTEGAGWLARLERVSVGGALVSLIAARLIVLFLAAAALGLLVLILSARAHRVPEKKTALFRFPSAGIKTKARSFGDRISGLWSARFVRGRSKGLFAHERFKLFFSGKIWLCVLLLVSASAVLITSSEEDVTAYERMYRRFVSEYSDGAWTAEKSAQVKERAAQFEQDVRLFRSAPDDYAAGRITEEEFGRIMSELGGAEVGRSVFRRVERYAAYLDAADGVMLYDTGWNRWFSRSPDYLLLLMAALLGSAAFAVEYAERSSSGGMAPVVRAAKKGRGKTLGAKTGVLALSVSAGWLVSELASVCALAGRYAFPAAGAPVKSLMLFGGGDAPIWLAALAASVGRLLFLVGAALLSASLTALTKSVLPGLLLLLSAVVIPLLSVLPSVIDANLLSSGGKLLVSGHAPEAAGIAAVLFACVFFPGARRWCVTPRA